MVKAFVMKVSKCMWSIEYYVPIKYIFKNDIKNFMCIRHADGRDNPYVFSSKVHYYIMGAHLLCTIYINSFLLKLKILNQIPIMHINGFMAC